jgi:hypothetical protein
MHCWEGHRSEDIGLASFEAGEIRVMAEDIQVEAARIPDRDLLLRELRDAGLDAHPVAEVGIEVHYPDELESAGDELLAQTEHLVMSLGAPFVPMKHEGVIYIRPPLD